MKINAEHKKSTATENICVLFTDITKRGQVAWSVCDWIIKKQMDHQLC